MTLSARWNGIIDRWMMRGVRYSKGGRDPEVGIDCWDGLVRALYRAAGIELPEGPDEVRELFSHVTDSPRFGDVCLFRMPDEVHAAVMLDDHIVAHVGHTGVRRSRLSVMRRSALETTIYRYHDDAPFLD